MKEAFLWEPPRMGRDGVEEVQGARSSIGDCRCQVLDRAQEGILQGMRQEDPERWRW